MSESISTTLMLVTILKRLKEEVLDLLFPSLCFGCGREDGFLCRECRDKLVFIPPSCMGCRKIIPGSGSVPPGRTCHSCRKKSHIYAFVSPFFYENEIIRELIHTLKYCRAWTIAPILAKILYDYVIKFQIEFSASSIVIPIPLFPNKERKRGFNQSELIGRELAAKLNLSFSRAILIKTKDTRPQAELSRKERLNNITGTLKVSYSAIVRNAVVILLDDVKTTGATLEEAARVLKEAGAKRIWAITVAH